MQLSDGKGRRAVLWGIGIPVGLLLVAVILRYYGPHAAIDGTYNNILKKSAVLSQMRIDLLKSVEMEKSAVMAVTDQESREFAGQSLAASAAVESDLALLRPLLDAAPMEDEGKLAVEFQNCWTEFRKLDHVILDLAVQNTNLKAAVLSREKGGEAMRRFEHALDDLVRPLVGTPAEARATRLSCRAVTAGLKLYNLHSAHIAEASDEKMDQLETQMNAEETEAAKALDELAGIAGEQGRAPLSQAKEAFSEFMGVTAQVIKLSRQNSNIKSLELSLGRKRNVAAQCDEILAAFQAAVQSRTFRATR